MQGKLLDSVSAVCQSLRKAELDILQASEYLECLATLRGEFPSATERHFGELCEDER